jgi:hypothetical protein
MLGIVWIIAFSYFYLASDKIIEHVKNDVFFVKNVNTGEMRAMRRLYKEESDRPEFDKLMNSWKELVEDEELVGEYVDHFYEGKNACLCVSFFWNVLFYSFRCHIKIL